MCCWSRCVLKGLRHMGSTHGQGVIGKALTSSQRLTALRALSRTCARRQAAVVTRQRLKTRGRLGA